MTNTDKTEQLKRAYTEKNITHITAIIIAAYRSKDYDTLRSIAAIVNRYTGIDFIDAVKRKIYGTIDIDLPVYLLEDLDEIEMVEYDITHLTGIDWCKYAIHIDLSGNKIIEIRELATLKRLEELYLSNNKISYIEPLFNLDKLRVLDLSFNDISDISPLFYLPELEYVNLTGNPVSEEQIARLVQNDVIVI